MLASAICPFPLSNTGAELVRSVARRIVARRQPSYRRSPFLGKGHHATGTSVQDIGHAVWTLASAAHCAKSESYAERSVEVDEIRRERGVAIGCRAICDRRAGLIRVKERRLKPQGQSRSQPNIRTVLETSRESLHSHHAAIRCLHAIMNKTKLGSAEESQDRVHRDNAVELKQDPRRP